MLGILSDIGKLPPEELTLLKQVFERDKRVVGELAEHGKGLGLSDEQVEAFIHQYRKEEKLTVGQLKERMSAQVHESQAKSTAGSHSVSAGRSLEGSRVRWREAFGAEADAVITGVMARSHSAIEVMGEVGLEIAMRRLGIEFDPRFISRYHGIDAIGAEQISNVERIGLDKQRRLVGLEAKGMEADSKALNTHGDGTKQLSWKANKEGQ
ncbi:hypothetical protein POL68_32025 [Stigmatella sp. ncwal1]|uniref:Uncharacterized protein n=1 Tax=Stigmatella ashevillensis TaxID=2995309 RepID=A0ABT5DK35_9BACT|nr:hypothetical protein [Stigmatella ashevillena]MDC0713133.1 hypothetical protein [Stigmatella ashevillena]